MHWLDLHSGSVQALATLATLVVTTVLAVLTAKYVRLTKSIADSATEQARILRESIATSRATTREALRAHAGRLHGCVKVLHDASPNREQLERFTLMSELDVTRLEELAKEYGEGLQPKAGAAATALKHLIGWHERAAKTNRVLGWDVTTLQVSDYVRARTDAMRMLSEIAAATSVSEQVR